MVVFKRHIDGTELAGWGLVDVSPDNFVRIFCGPVASDPRHLLRFQELHLVVTTPLSSLVLLKLLDGQISSFPRGERVRVLFDSKHAARATLWYCSRKQKHIALACKCYELLLRLKCKFHMQGMNVLMLLPPWACLGPDQRLVAHSVYQKWLDIFPKNTKTWFF